MRSTLEQQPTQQAIQENEAGYDAGVEGRPMDSTQSDAWQAGWEQGAAVRREIRETDAA